MLTKGENYFCITIWKVWCSRNDWMHNGKQYDVNEEVWWSRNYVDEIRRVGCSREMGVATDGRSGEEVGDSWRPLDHGMLKINCNFRVDKRRKRIGFGIIVRDDGGRVLMCWAQGCEVNYNMDSAKAMAVYKGIIVGRDMGLVNHVVETDSATVIKQIVKGGNSEASYSGILDAIQILVSDARNVIFQHVSTKANRVALKLVNEALSITDVAVWKEDVPMCNRALVEGEQRS
ncbi:hypothetical protein LWI29_000629 [Acer saccharum]|uniref:RNase H type-1 domain-containing protein n=1 Tax=Acer saccharum TaxID=4024 RepID=A0AA39SF40_ACESA|nr:hypothetical protein LWI29_000629 [Acer saccharum]